MKDIIGNKWEGKDSVYTRKTISTWIVELIGGTERGAYIKMWNKASTDEIESAEKLPHIFTVTEDRKYNLLATAHFMYFVNATAEYSDIKTVKDIFALAKRTT